MDIALTQSRLQQLCHPFVSPKDALFSPRLVPPLSTSPVGVRTDTQKAAVEQLAMELRVEEPDVICVSVKPGVVNTEMQSQVRIDHASTQDAKDVELFKTLHEKGALLKPHQPGNVLARLALRCPDKLNGQNLPWNDDCLKAF